MLARTAGGAAALAMALTLVVAQARATPSPEADGARLMALCKAASGGAALDRPAGFHESGTVVRGGVKGTYEYWGDLHVLRSSGRHVLGGKLGGGGFDGQLPWVLAGTGRSYIDASARAIAAARTGSYVSIGGYFYPDRFPARFVSLGRRTAGGTAYDVVAVTPQGGDTADLWLDAKTHRLARLSADTPGARDVGVITLYKQIDGTWIGFANRQSDGDPAHDMIQTLTRYTYGPVDPAMFEKPKATVTPP